MTKRLALVALHLLAIGGGILGAFALFHATT